ncbi:MAG: helix-turn-helix transcriptional regulator [Actinomycetales bacterium]|nr:helix-turn-helix transcriptional regulator [Actinomycetales bacterium]
MSAPDTAARAVRDAEDPDGARRLGARVRRLRHARGLTLVQLAERSELSHPFLSQLERGLARPSFASLEKIARALGSSQLELLADAEPEPRPLVEPQLSRAGEGARGPYAGGEARLLVSSEARMRPMEFEGAGSELTEFFTHDEEEFVYLLAGRVEAEIEGRAPEALAVGDGLYIPGGAGHRWRSLDGAPYRLLVVKERPRRA